MEPHDISSLEKALIVAVCAPFLFAGLLFLFV
jgi:hypothetical protein